MSSPYIRTVLFTVLLVLFPSVLGEDRPICGPIRSCSNYIPTNAILYRSCHCDEKCPDFNDCCQDSPYRGPPLKQTDLQCTEGNWPFPVYLQTKCPDSWNKSDLIRRDCESNFTVIQDPYSTLPVTNPRTKITYKNYNCALCNKDMNIIAWDIRVECSSLKSYNETYGNLTDDYYRENLSYNNDVDQWGVLFLTDGKETFYSCSVNFEPGLLDKSIRSCTAGVISDCDSSWGLDSVQDVRRMCLAFKNVVYSDSFERNSVYRNVYCAICNFENVSSVMVEADELKNYNCYDTPESFPTFVTYFDVNPKDANESEDGEDEQGLVEWGKVGGKQCAAGESYDPFKRDCRNFLCPKGEKNHYHSCLE